MYVRHEGLEPAKQRALANQTTSDRRQSGERSAIWLYPPQMGSHIKGYQGHGEASPTLGTLRDKPSYVCMDSWTNYLPPPHLGKPAPLPRDGRPRPAIRPVNADRAVGVVSGFSGGLAASATAAAVFAAFLGGGVADAEEDWESGWVGVSSSTGST